jgi:glyoxylase-like metal-dependent hydrolase (beta-lactamase superfamily II)
MEIIPGLHRITGVMGNPHLIIDPDGLTLVDAGTAGSRRRILGAIKQLGYAPEQLRRILITHADGDHVGAVAALVALSGARVYASAVEADAMAAGRPSRELRLPGLWRVLHRLAQPLLRVQPFGDAEIIREGDVLPALGGLHVIETPGHTPGHLSFFAPAAGVLFAGDSIAYRNGRMRKAFTLTVWNEALAWESLRKQAALRPAIVCLGHGPVVRDAATKFPVEILSTK